MIFLQFLKTVHISTGYLSSAWYYCIWDYSDIKMQWIVLSSIYPIINGFTSLFSFSYANAILALSLQQSYITIQMRDQTFTDILKVDLSQSNNFTVWSSRINCQNRCLSGSNYLFLDSSNQRLHVATIADYKFMFFTLSPNDGSMILNTNTHYSNDTWTYQFVHKMHMRDDILYIPIECKELTLLIYNTTDDQFYDIYVLASTSYSFREVYL